MNSFRIIRGGILTTVQDYGRKGYQQYGVSVGGAMDRYSLALANILVGNERHEAALEITLSGLSLQFEMDTMFALTGADLGPLLNNQKVGMYQTVLGKKGDILSFNSVNKGMRAYMAVMGGIDVPQVMGSKSTYLMGKIGGYKGRKLSEGDVIATNKLLNPLNYQFRSIPRDLIPNYTESHEIRVIMGPEDEAFTAKGIEAFLNSPYKLTTQLDRMGYRLEGQAIEHKNSADIVSAGINWGAIQVPGHGQPIIMMSDRQTTGGYTKIANVISVDLHYLAQLKPGDSITFKKISIEKAHELLIEQEQRIVRLINSFSNNADNISRGCRKFLIKVNGKEYSCRVQEIGID